MNISYIEPCCVEKQLPPMLREYSLVPFQTNGDVTFDKLIKAVSSLAGNKLFIWLMITAVDTDMLRVLAWYARRDWLASLRILTQEDQSTAIYNEIKSVCTDLHCYHNSRVQEDMLLIQGEQGSVVVQGRLSSHTGTAHRFYTAYYTKREYDIPLGMLITTALSLFRNEDTPAETDDTTTEQSAEENTTEQAAEQPSEEQTAEEQATEQPDAEEATEETATEIPSADPA